MIMKRTNSQDLRELEGLHTDLFLVCKGTLCLELPWAKSAILMIPSAVAGPILSGVRSFIIILSAAWLYTTTNTSLNELSQVNSLTLRLDIWCKSLPAAESEPTELGGPASELVAAFAVLCLMRLLCVESGASALRVAECTRVKYCVHYNND